MPITSYAQQFEDVLLWRALSGVEAGTYIDIGAQDPSRDSVSKAFYENGWRGVHVEPVAHYSELLRRERPDEVVIQAAISAQSGVLRFFEIPNTGISTASADVAETHRQRGWEVIERLVPAITLDTVFDAIASEEIHWLKIDVEGWEKSVLESWSSPRRPWIVVVEATRPLSTEDCHESWEDLIVGRGYEFVGFDGLNRFYVSQEHPELAGCFRLPPCIWDRFQLTEHHWATKSLVSRHHSALEAASAESAARLQEMAARIAHLEAEIESHRIAARGDQVELSRVAGELRVDLAAVGAERDILATQVQAANDSRNQMSDALQAVLQSHEKEAEASRVEQAAKEERIIAAIEDLQKASAAAEALSSEKEVLIRRIAALETEASNVRAESDAERRSNQANMAGLEEHILSLQSRVAQSVLLPRWLRPRS